MSDSLKKLPSVGAGLGIGGAKRIGLTCIFLWFFVGALAHFVATDLEATIIPPYIPWPLEVVLISGVFELLGALGLLWGRQDEWPALGFSY